MQSMSVAVRILLVACRSRQSKASSRLMPQPLSVTRIRLRPPALISTRICVLPASIEFSISSLQADAGRSTTSPAAILLATASAKIRIRFTRKNKPRYPLIAKGDRGEDLSSSGSIESTQWRKVVTVSSSSSTTSRTRGDSSAANSKSRRICIEQRSGRSPGWV